MARKIPFFNKKTKSLSVAQQAYRLLAMYKNSKIKLRNQVLIWIGEITPTPMSLTYTVSITYRLRKIPKVKVINPKLLRHKDEKLPHVFRGEELCLFKFDWNSSMPIADTIVPWASLWLFYYEIWVRTGKWYGGGEHPPSGKKYKDFEECD